MQAGRLRHGGAAQLDLHSFATNCAPDTRAPVPPGPSRLLSSQRVAHSPARVSPRVHVPFARHGDCERLCTPHLPHAARPPVCVGVDGYMCVYTCQCVCTCTQYVCGRECLCVCTYSGVCMHVGVCGCVSMCIQVSMCMYAHVLTRVSVYTHIHTDVCVYYMYVHAQTHAYVDSCVCSHKIHE